MAGEKEQPKPVLEGETCIAGRPQTETQFIQHSLKELKQMLDGVKPETIEEAGRNWGKVNDILVGGEGQGIAGLLDKAVDNVLEHWEGEAARAFEKQARKISQSIRNAAWHADLNSSQMADAARQLRHYKPQLDAIEEPSGWAKVGDALSDWSWDNGESTAEDLKDRKLTTAEVAKINEGKIGASREAHLNGVAVMENLGAQYMRVTRNLNNNKPIQDSDGNIKEPNRDVEYPPPVTPGGVGGASRPGVAAAGNRPWSAGPPKGIGTAPTVPRPKGITGGAPLPPTTRTNVDSIKPGLTGPGLSPGPIPGGGGGGGGGAMPPGGIAPIGGPGLGGAGGGRSAIGGPRGISPAARSGLGAPGGRAGLSGGPGGAGANRGTGGRAGMGGMGGGAGAGAAGRGGAGAGNRGALAKARGGVVGAAKGISGKGAGGGAGLHGSRGGSQRGGMPGGMAGGMGGRNGRRAGDENERGERPDYLVEDEETWISEEDRNRNVPRNIQ
ncbi:WXG100 family type VII secretion target [Streptomyces albidochromogenes]|uniref:WXG100 family type VII secretion target n=1 Tax=Streptomyces albidochromogenes TaxID=329524 RepID=A0ABW6FDP5_9ACTN